MRTAASRSRKQRVSYAKLNVASGPSYPCPRFIGLPVMKNLPKKHKSWNTMFKGEYHHYKNPSRRYRIMNWAEVMRRGLMRNQKGLGILDFQQVFVSNRFLFVFTRCLYLTLSTRF